MRWFFAIAIFLGITSLNKAEAAEQIFLRSIQVFEDAENKIPISQIVSLKNKGGFFTSSSDSTLNFGFTRSTYWISFPVQTDQQNEELWLQLAYPILQSVEVYLFDHDGKLVMQTKAGTEHKVALRKLFTSNIVIPLHLKQSRPYQVYISVRTRGSMEIPLSLWRPKDWIAHNDLHNLLQGIFFGALGVMVFYNVFVYLSVRSISYLFYVGFVISFMIFQSLMKGFAFLYVLPNHQNVVIWLLPLSVGFCSLFSIGFALSFLKFHGTKSLIAYALYGLAAFFSACIFAIPFVSYRVIVSTLSVSSTLGCALMLTAGINRWMAGRTEARFYVLAWTFYTVGGVLFGLSKLGIITSNFYTLNAQQIGVLLESILISMALADRLNTLQRENKQYGDNLAQANDKLKSYVESVEQIVASKTRNIKSIFATIRAGIFTIDNKMIIEAEYSPFLEEIMGRTVGNAADPIDFLFRDTDVREDVKSSVRSTLVAALGEPIFAWDVNTDHLPKEFKLVKNGSAKTINCEFSPIVRDEIVERILIVIKDITEIRKLETESKEAKKELDMLHQVSQLDGNKFRMFVHSSCHWLNTDPELVKACSESERQFLIQKIFIHMHTLKGNASSLGLWFLVEAAHISEQYLSGIRDNPALWDEQLIIEKLRHLASVLKRYERVFVQRFGRDTRASVSLDVVGLERAFLQVTPEDWRLLKNSPTVESLLNLVSHSLWKDAQAFLSDLTKNSARLATELGKPEPLVKVNADKILLPSKAQDFFFNTVTHLLRNALDHGLENESERLRKGKPVRGLIALELKNLGEHVQFLFHDDGQGINLDLVMCVAQSKNLVIPGRNYSAGEIAEFILHPGFSTRKTISLVSGRGVGLDAVRSHVLEYGGSMIIRLGRELTQNIYPLTFEILLPRHYFYIPQYTSEQPG